MNHGHPASSGPQPILSAARPFDTMVLMATVEASILVERDPRAVFDLSQDYALRLRWDPFLREMTLMNGASAQGPGVRTRVRAKNGLTMEVECVSFAPPRVVAVKMTDGPSIFSSFAGAWRFEPDGPERTTVLFSYSFRTRPAFLRWLVDPVARLVFLRNVRARLEGLKRFSEASRPCT